MSSTSTYAQTTPPPARLTERPATPGWLTHSNFHLALEKFAIDDEQFSWDADFGGDVDVVDWTGGRINLGGNVEAVMGRELQRFDPNQNNYTIDLLGAARLGRDEAATIFRHVSRHVGDRERPFPVNWNLLGGRYWLRRGTERTTIDISGHAAGVVAKTSIDYVGELGLQASIRYLLERRVALTWRGSAVRILVDEDVWERSDQNGGRAELGVTFIGRGAAVEFFVGAERRIDADAFEASPKSWFMVGFRIQNP